MVALTEVDICKLALSRLRVEIEWPAVDDVADLDPDATKAERELQTWYAQTVSELHEKIAWRAQVVFAELELLDTDDGEQPWSGTFLYRFLYPADAADLRAIRVPLDGRKLVRQREYDISQAEVDTDEQGRVIMANDNPLNVEYVQSPTDPQVYGTQALVCKAIAFRLAVNIGPGLGVSDATMQTVRADYAIALAEACSKDANEAEEGDPLDGDYVQYRRMG